MGQPIGLIYSDVCSLRIIFKVRLEAAARAAPQRNKSDGTFPVVFSINVAVLPSLKPFSSYYIFFSDTGSICGP